MRIAPEGVPIIIATWFVLAVLIVAAVFAQAWWTPLATVWGVICLWVPWFFRDPVRSGPRDDDLVLAPADGKVVSIVETDEPDYLKRRVTRVSVFMNVFDVHVNRLPVSGVVEYQKYRPGKFVNATRDKASVDNEQISVGIRSRKGAILVRQIAGLVARRIVNDTQPGHAVQQGERLGIIRFGSRVDTFIPENASVTVKVGERTSAGVTVIAKWPS